MIVVIGTGYVGLVTGTCFAEMGNQVICVDIDEHKLQMLQEDKIPFFEPMLGEFVARNRAAGRLHFTNDYSAVAGVQVCFLALPTPSCEDGSCDLSYLFSAAEAVAQKMCGELIVVIKSTVPVGTAHQVREILRASLEARGVDYPFEIVSNPEFLREGNAVADCMKPDRIIFGVESQRATDIMKKLYAPFTMSHDRILVMDIKSAELAKYAANAMLATRISFMNELAHLCEKIGAQINQVRIALGSDHRIGMHYLYPGLGYGGSCLPKDLRALKAIARECDVPTPLLDSVDWINQKQRERFLQKVIDHFGTLSGKTLAIWGLSFKPDTDDLREAPSLYLIHELHRRGAFLRIFDPVALDKAELMLGKYDQIAFCGDEYSAAEGADAILLITEWKQFRLVDFSKILLVMKGRAFFDGRNQYSPAEMQALGFEYFCVGMPSQIMVERFS